MSAHQDHQDALTTAATPATPYPARSRTAHPLQQTRLPLHGRPTTAPPALLPVDRKINGKTHTTLLTAEQMDRYRPWFDNAKKIRSLTADLEALCLEIANATEELDITPNAAGSRFDRKA